MKLYNIKTPSEIVSLTQAVFKPLAKDRGLYLPLSIEELDSVFFSTFTSQSFDETAFLVTHHLLKEDLSAHELKEICTEAFNFDVPLVSINDDVSILELFHGPTLAFKDFGARFMSRLMSLLRRKNNIKSDLTILVATSGDTGGAVASGFHNVENIEVYILYPKGKVSKLQQKQLSTHGGNIHALEINGTFDDCQTLVKDAFIDAQLNNAYNLSSANSINISRLIPQSLYYFEAYKKLILQGNINSGDLVNFCIPSGNFGNLCAGLIAKSLGLPINKLIAANNINDPVTKYIQSGQFVALSAQATLSNAMDIGNPSNFPRLVELTGSTWNNFIQNISAYSFSDESTVEEIKFFYKKYKYVLDPHTAVGTLAAKAYKDEQTTQGTIQTIVLSTAHPSKFIDETKTLTQVDIDLPPIVHELLDKVEHKVELSSDFQELKNFLLSKK